MRIRNNVDGLYGFSPFFMYHEENDLAGADALMEQLTQAEYAFS